MHPTSQSVVDLINNCSSLSNDGKVTVDHTLYQIRKICSININHPYYRYLYDRIVSVQTGELGPITSASIDLMLQVRNSIEDIT